MVAVTADSQYRSRDQCPTAVCSTYLDPATCGVLDYAGYSYLLQPCSYGFTCPPPNSISSQDSLTCEPTADPYGFQYTSVKELDLRYNHPERLAMAAEVVMRDVGEACGGDGVWCARDQGAVCQCKGECRCVAAGQEGERCSDDMSGEYPGCTWGYGCYQNYCEPWFSLTRSVQVNDPWLCASMSTYEDGYCKPAESSVWTLTSPCFSSSDCVGSNGSLSECTCGLLGQAYCSPFPMDDPYLQLKQAILQGDLQKHAYWRMVVENWAFLQREDGRGGWVDLPGCVGGVWPDLLPYLQTLTYHGDVLTSAASFLSLAFTFLLTSS